MKKIFFNISIDVLSFVFLVMMLSTGLLLKFILPPGSGHHTMFLSGSGRQQKTIDLFMGLSRHEWGQIHFVLACFFLLILICHLLLHRQWIKTVIVNKMKDSHPLLRKVILGLLLIFVVIIMALPWLIKTKTYPKDQYLQMKHSSKF